MNPAKRGEVGLVDLGNAKDDHEQAGQRPAVIFQTDDLSRLNTVVIIPLTTQLKRAGFASTVSISSKEAGARSPIGCALPPNPRTRSPQTEIQDRRVVSGEAQRSRDCSRVRIGNSFLGRFSFWVAPIQ